MNVLHKIKEGLRKGTLRNTGEVVKLFEDHMTHASEYDWALTTNDGIAHLKDDVEFKTGDVVKFDSWYKHNGLWYDAAISQAFKADNPYMVVVARKALIQGILAAKVGNMLSDISKAIQKEVELTRYQIIKQLSGHGIGEELHMPPRVMNHFLPKHEDLELEPGMRLAIEPLLTDVGNLFDKETWRTNKGGLSVHYEATIEVGFHAGKILYGGI